MGKTEMPDTRAELDTLIEDLSLVPNGIIDNIADYLESAGFDCTIKDNQIAFKTKYEEYMLFLNEDLSVTLNYYIHISPGHCAPFLKKMAATPNMEHGINRIIESDHEYIFSVDIPPLNEDSYKEQLEYYTRLLHDYEFELFHLM